MVLGIWEQLSTASYAISTNEHPLKSKSGEVATTTVTLGENKLPFELYKMKSGLWGFHL